MDGKSRFRFSDIFRAYAPYAVKPILQHIVRIFRVELPRTDTPVDSRAGAVLSFVRADKNGRTRADIENYLGVSRPTAHKIIEGLLASGELMRIGKHEPYATVCPPIILKKYTAAIHFEP